MPSLPLFLAPLALLFPVGWQAPDGSNSPVLPQQEAHQIREKRLSPSPLSEDAPAWSPVFDGVGPEKNQQVRIERRVILRISPARSTVGQNLAANSAQANAGRRIVERPFAKCVDSAAIGGVTDHGDRLVMFTRDRRTLFAKLEKGCSPRDFYRGFYMERSADGKICVNRDRLLSRAGAKCQVTRFTQLAVEAAD